MPKYDYFVAHHFTEQGNDDLREAIENAFKGKKLNPYYADNEVRESGTHILDKIIKKMKETKFGIFDVTDGNPNVCLELGLAKGLGRTFFIICKKESINNIPSDLKGLDRIDYGSHKELTKNLKKKILPRVLEIENPSKTTTEDDKSIKSLSTEQDIKEHISNLKDMLRLWKQNLSSNKVAPAEETFALDAPSSVYARAVSDRLESSLRDIENHALFEDIFHHFPNLRNFWNEFKNLSNTYNLERQGLFGKIEGQIKQKLKKHNFDFESEIGKGFPFSVYSDIVRITKGKNNIYDYFIDRVSVKGVEKTRLNYGYTGSGSDYILAEIEPERIEEVKNIHKEMIKECEEIYLSDIKKIIELENKTRDSRNKLESMLGEIIYLMVFPQMDCKFIK